MLLNRILFFIQKLETFTLLYDVFDVGPLEEDDTFLKFDNVTITPHAAGSTRDAFTNSPKLMREILIRVINKDEHLPIVNGREPQLEI